MSARETQPWKQHPLAEPFEVVLDEVRRARRALKPPGEVHEARRALKRARALLRLYETGYRKDTARRLRRGLRDTGRTLSDTRDQEVAVEVAREMERDFGSPPALVAELEAQRLRAQEQLDAGLGRTARSQLSVSRRELSALAGAVSPADAVAGLGRAYHKAREAFHEAAELPSTGRMHTLRKRVKDFRYQVEWAAGIWPPVLEGWIAELQDLTDELGRIQDIRVLRVAGHGLSDPGDRRRLARALEGLRGELRRLRRRAFGRCERLFAEDPEAFRARMVALARL